MGFVRQGITTFVQDKISKRVRNTFLRFNPVFYFLGLNKADAKSEMGRPNAGAVFGGERMGSAQRMSTLGSFNHQIQFVRSEPNDGDTLENGGQTPVSSQNAEENFGTAEFRWTHFWEPWKVSKHAVEAARGETQMRSVIETAALPVYDRFLKRVAQNMWTGAPNAAAQNATVWNSLIGLQAAGTTGNTWGRVDRSVETQLDPLVIDSTTQLPDTAIDLDIARKVNVGFTDELSADIEGLATKEEMGEGATLWITTPTLWQSLASQAEGRYQIHVNGIPGAAIGGFKRPIIQKDNVYYTWDPMCPAGEMHGLCPREWVIEIEPGHNFREVPVVDKSETEQGGEYILWGAYDLKIRMLNRAPDLHCRITGLTEE